MLKETNFVTYHYSVFIFLSVMNCGWFQLITTTFSSSCNIVPVVPIVFYPFYLI